MSSPSVSSADVPALPAAAAPSRSPLYRDALSSVLSFLSLHELAAVLSVNKEWSAAVQTMRPAMLTADIFAKELDGMLASRLRRHVGELGKWDERCEYKLSLQSNELPPLTRALPQLVSLSGMLSLVDDALPVFPSQLQRLHVRLRNSASGLPVNATQLLAAIGQLHQLHTLRLRMFQNQADLSLRALQQLPLLRDLHVAASIASVAQFAADMRALPWLHRLRIGTAEGGQTQLVALLHALLGDVPEEELRTLQWRDFTLDGFVFTDELTPLLLRLPLLERLSACLSRCTRFDFLTALARLTQLELHLRYMKTDAWRSLLGVFTSDGLTRLHTLALRQAPCSSDELVQLLSHTPSLTSFVFDRLPDVRWLSFFSQLPTFANTLTQLTVECDIHYSLGAAVLPSLYVLQQLRELRLRNWPEFASVRLTVADRAPFQQRPCIVLPQLEVFEWTTAGD
jgi:hypothetical protein